MVGKRPGLVSPVPSLPPPARPRPRRRPQRPTLREPPPLLPKEACWVQATRLHAGSGTAGRERGGQNTSLLAVAFGVCHRSFFTRPSACTPARARPGEGAAWRGGPGGAKRSRAQAPCGPCPSVSGADRSAGRQGGGEDGAARGPSVSPARLRAPATACSLSGPGCEGRRVHPGLPPRPRRLLPPSLPPHPAKKTPVRPSLCPLEPRTCGPWPRIGASLTRHPGQCRGPPKAKDPGGAGPGAPLALPGPCGEWPLAPILRERRIFPR